MRTKSSTISKTLSIFLTFISLTLFIGIFWLAFPTNQIKAGSPTEIIFSDDFESTLANWTATPTSSVFMLSSDQAYTGSKSLYIDDQPGSLYHKIPVTDINSPNRAVTFYWYPVSAGTTTAFSVLSLEEGAWDSAYTDKSVEMFWNGSQVYFSIYTYADGSRQSSTSSATVSVSNDAWHRIEIYSSTTATTIEIDDTPIQFNGQSNSSVLTNIYNWIRFSNLLSTTLSDDDGSYNAYTGYINTTRYKKEFNITYSSSSINSALLMMRLDKDAALVGNLVVDVNGQRALSLSNNDISPANANPGVAWYSFTIDKSLLVQGVNDIVIYGEGGTTNIVLHIDTDSISTNRSARSTDSGATWDYDRLRDASGPDGEYMVRLSLEIAGLTYYIDDIIVAKEDIVDTSNLFGRTFDKITGTDSIYAIYGYLLTRDNAYLTQAQSAANTIQSSYDSGNKNLFYIKEIALLATFDSTRIELLNNLVDLCWTYRVNQTTYLPYSSIDSSGNVTNYNTYVATAPDALSVVNGFMFAYEATGNTAYIDYAKQVLNAIYNYMRHPTYGTIVTSVHATSTAITINDSRVGDEVANFIETALFLYEMTDDSTFLDYATSQANLFTQYAWDKTRQAFHYKPNDSGWEVYGPSFSVALLHLYGHTGNSTYLDNAKNNFSTFLTQLTRNGMLLHYFLSNGRFGHEPAYFEYDVPVAAALLYKYTNDGTYLDISDEYTSILLDYFYPLWAQGIYSNNFQSMGSLPIYNRYEYTTDLLYRFVLPSSGVNIYWSHNSDLHGHYRGLASAPLNVWFERDAVHLGDVSGNGTIKLYPDIKKVYITPRAGSRIGLQMLSNLSIIPVTGSVDVEIGDSFIDIDYHNSIIAGLSVNNVDRQIDVNNQGTSSMILTPSTSSVDVIIDTWNTTSTYYKKWTESATASNITTEHTIGDLRANQYYQVKVDDSVIETLQANSLGQITFTYSGGYSTKTFEVEEIPKPPTIGTPTILSSNSIRWNFTDNADNETGFRLYDSNGTLIKTVATANLSYIEETDLTPGTTYSRYIKSYNSYGESVSSAVMSAQTGSAPVSSNPPASPSPTSDNPLGGFRVVINDNATSTNKREVSLKFHATSEITKVAISESPHMSGSSFQPFQSILPWTLSKENGLKTIYAVLANQYGVKTPIIQDSITLIVPEQAQTGQQQPETDEASDESQDQPTEPDPIPDISLPNITLEKPINQMTQEEIASKMKEIQQAISQLQSLLSQIQLSANEISDVPSDFQFSTDLKPNISLIDVRYLQILLNQDKDTQVAQTGAGSPNNETTFFGPRTTQAVIRFQEKYKNTILSPWNLIKGTGFVGKTTRDKLNELLNR